MASKVSIMSTWTVRAGGTSVTEEQYHQDCKIIELTPWDIFELQFEHPQNGVLYLMPTFEQVRHVLKATNTTSLIDHLRTSLSRALDFFPPFSSRLETTKDHTTTSFFINCNNAGAQLIHATANDITVSDILESYYVPHVVRDFFPLNGVQNQEGTSHPVLAVQVTELVDGIFIGCANNHIVADGASFWDFYASWAEISRGFTVISKIPSFKRQSHFTNNHRISIPNDKINNTKAVGITRFIPPPTLRHKVFHFTKDNVAKLKEKANHEINTTKISSLQAVLAHVWRSIIRCRRLDHNQETTFDISINMRERLNPPLHKGFFGNAICPATITIRTGELLEHGLGWAALQLNEMIAAHDHEKFKCMYESFISDPKVPKLGDLPSSNYFMLLSSSRFNFYSYDFGWGKPIAYRSGMGSMLEGKITVSPGVEQGSINLEVCQSSETIHALEEDIIFGEFVTTYPVVGSEQRTIRARI